MPVLCARSPVISPMQNHKSLRRVDDVDRIKQIRDRHAVRFAVNADRKQGGQYAHRIPQMEEGGVSARQPNVFKAYASIPAERFQI